METSVSVANWFISKDQAEGCKEVCPFRIQKLVYLSYGWHLAIANKPLTQDAPLTRRWGPYFPVLFSEILLYVDGNSKLTEPLSNRTVSPSLTPFLERIWEVHSQYTAVQLSRLTTSDDSPWKTTVDDNPDREHIQIPDNLLQSYYIGLANA